MNIFDIKCEPIGRGLYNVLVTRLSDYKEYSLDFKVPAKTCIEGIEYRKKKGVDYAAIEDELYNDILEFSKDKSIKKDVVSHTWRRVAGSVRNGLERFKHSVIFINDMGELEARTIIKDNR